MDALSGDVETRKALATDVAVARHAGQQLAVYYKNKAFLCLLKENKEPSKMAACSVAW